MFIAHIPVGLAIGRLVSQRPLKISVTLAAITGAIFPDLDLIRFYFFDNHQRHHHDYWTHIPAVWVCLMMGWGVVMKLSKKSFGTLPLVFFIAVLSHLILDTMAGAIEWFWPFSDKGFHFVTVPASHSKWYLSFLTHWTFTVEVFVSLLALGVALSGHGYQDAKDAGEIAGETEAGRR